eukprot:scaffold141169_cov34-Attheya_sp.AAC.2
MLSDQAIINKQGKQPNFSAPNYNKSDQEILWCSSNHKPFLGRLGNRKDILMRWFLLRIERILDTSSDFELVALHDKDMGLTDDTVHWLEHDFWSKYCISFCKKIGSRKFNVGAFKYHIAGGRSTTYMVLFKVPHVCKMEDENVMRAFKQAADDALWHANWAETNDFINTTKEASNLPTKKMLAIVIKLFQISRKYMQLPWTRLGWSSSWWW